MERRKSGHDDVRGDKLPAGNNTCDVELVEGRRESEGRRERESECVNVCMSE